MKKKVKRCRLCGRKKKKLPVNPIRDRLRAMGVGRVPPHPGAVDEPSRLPK